MRSPLVFTLYTPLLLAISLALAGCGAAVDPGPPRAEVKGKVTYKGQPVAVGRIRFVPDQGPSTQGPIAQGLYQLDQNGGVPIGKHKVSIESDEPTGKEIVIVAGGEKAKEMKQVLPDKYNKTTTLTAEVAKGKSNEINFDLKE